MTQSHDIPQVNLWPSYQSSRPLLVAAALVSFFNAATALADECRDILEQGIRNTYEQTRNGDLRSNLSSAFCQSSLNQVRSRSGGGFSLGFNYGGSPVSLGGDFNDQNGKSFQQEACAQGASNLSNSNYEKLLQHVADENIVRAWSQCNQTSGGLLLDGRLNEDTLILSLRFRNSGNIHQTTLNSNAQVRGASCEDIPWKSGTVITGSVQYVQCERHGEQPVTVTVNSEFNGAMFYLPRKPQLELVNEERRNDPDDVGDVMATDPDGGRRWCFRRGAPGEGDRQVCRQSLSKRNGEPCTCGSDNPWGNFTGYVNTVYQGGVLRAPGNNGTSNAVPSPVPGAIPAPQ
ncbi:hypothetical protein LVV83_22175 [Pseudomonas sp. LM20]|uniref:hypothetical protein n=1 Tax=Pseudomonas sp. LM20 TaxID=2899116 RepID=UPI001F19AB35|nr:hypothetical protein [Pseudomonas sp. LM20]MCE5989733.1 hypothetical protein [Pseudomonas sp. LM20]